MLSSPSSDETALSLVGRRYRLLETIGRGGMGVVYRAQDLLGGQVALKRLHQSVEEIERAATEQSGVRNSSAWALSLAHEFRTLASMRHPNIISVLDYGFDSERRPYLTMDLLEGCQTLVEAARGLGLQGKLDLLVQVLRAIAYLHRYGVIHRDLKPHNVMVSGGQVKVLDFGIALGREELPHARRAGTPGYVAPEVMLGGEVSESSDLFAVGVMAHEVILGRLPFRDADSVSQTVTGSSATIAGGSAREVMPSEFRAPLEMDLGLARVLSRLLAFEPRDRFPSADAVIAALYEAAGRPLPPESAAARESFLQAARFVGRGEERARLSARLDRAMGGHGAALLIAGESGVGKSRLLDELRARALVRGAVAVRGQSVSEGGGPYHALRPLLRWLPLLGPLTNLEASVLKPLVPDLETLLGRKIDDPAPLDAEMEQARLLAVVEDAVARQKDPLLLIVEDLHWARSETLALLERLSARVSSAPVLLVGSFRDDERPDLPGRLRDMEVLRLGRLDEADIARLAESMLGPKGREPELTRLLRKETEGNPFFLVEVVRALAEEAGRLDRIGEAGLPEKVVAGGVRAIVQRRIGKVSGPARELLLLSALVGRQIDLAVLRALAPGPDTPVDLDAWLQTCADAAVLDVADGRWQFAHDKLREGLLVELPHPERPPRHRRVAEAIERAHGDDPTYAEALALHWRHAGDADREAHWAERAGEQALRLGASREAVALLERALTLVDRGAPPKATGLRALFRRDRSTTAERHRHGHLEGLLAEAHYQVGDLRACREHAARALSDFGRPMPSSGAGWVAGTLRQAGERALMSVRPQLFADGSEEGRRARLEAGRLQARLTDVFIFSQESLPLIWSGLRMLNLTEPAGDSPDLARGYTNMVVVAGTVPVRPIAEAWSRRALELAERVGGKADRAFVLNRNAVYSVYLGRWAEVDEWLGRATELVDGVGDLRLAEECRSLAALAAQYRGQFERCLELWAWVGASARRRGAIQTQQWEPMGSSVALARLGRHDEAIQALEKAAPWVKEHGATTDVIWTQGVLALARLRTGEPAAAREAAERALERIVAIRPVAHWNQAGIWATAEVLLALWENEARPGERTALARQAHDAVRGMRAFGKVFPFGVPAARLLAGCAAWLDGDIDAARRAWIESRDAAARLSMPYEEARARFELARHLDRHEGARSLALDEVAESFQRLGAADDAARARAEQDR